MKKCKYCQSEIAIKAKVCPNCGKKQQNKWLIIIVIIFAIIGISSLSGNDSKEEVVGKTESKKENLVLDDNHKGYVDEYGFSYYIEGYVTNNTDKEYEYVDITFDVYDEEGNNIGSCWDNNSGLDPKGRWKFKAICSGEAEEIASYKLDEITGY